jgi:hypothetical protein
VRFYDGTSHNLEPLARVILGWLLEARALFLCEQQAQGGDQAQT